MVDTQTVELLTWLCLSCVLHDCLADLDYKSLIDLLEECLVLADYCNDPGAVFVLYQMLGDYYLKSREFYKAIEYNENSLILAVGTGDIEVEGRSYGNLGNAYRSLGEYHRAIEYHEKSLSIAKEIGIREFEGHEYRNLGIAYDSIGEYHKAIEYHEKCLSIAREIGDKREEVNSCAGLGNAYQALGEFGKAIQYHEKGLTIARETGDREGEGICYGDLGNVYGSSADYQKAIECHERSLSIAKEIGSREAEGIATGCIGNGYSALGEYHKAIEYQEKSLKIAKEIGSILAEGNTYESLGNAYHSLGEYHKSIEYYEKSLSIAKDICNRTGEGSNYGRLGNAYQALGEYHNSIECYEKSLSIVKEIGQREIEGGIYGNLGMAYEKLGEYHTAIAYFEKCLSIAKDIGNRAGEGHSYGNLGIAYKALGEHQKAIQYHKKSLESAKAIGDRAKEGNDYGNLGIAYESIGEHHKAIECCEKSLGIARDVCNRAGEGSTYATLGRVYRSLEEYHKAMETQEKGLRIAKEIGDRMTESFIYHNIGHIYRSESSLKNLCKAEENLKNSIECSEKVFDDLKEKDQFKISFVETYVIAYKSLVEVQLETNQTEKAVLTCERGRARALRDLMSVKYNTTEKPTSNQNLLEIDDVLTISSGCNACVLFYDLHPNKLTARLWVVSPQSNSIFVYDEMAELEAVAKIVSRQTKDEIQNIKNGYFHHLVEKSYMTVRDVMRCEDRSLDSLQSEDLGHVSSESASQSSGTASNIFRELSRWLADADEDDDAPLEIMFHRLVTPVLERLTTEEIVIIPDGPLFMLPFAALQDQETGKYLSEIKRLRLAPSLTTLKILQESSEDHHFKSGALIIGDPAVGEVMYRGKLKRDIHRLPGARDEAIEIGKLLGVEPLTGEKATKEAVLSKLQHGVSVIHFAAHGSARNGQIFLAPSRSSSSSAVPEEKDYMLTMKDAQDSGIRAQLVVLSCCHTGRGDIKAEGVVGMTRAFLAAGARAVVASLWAIDDLATKFFMLKFYSHLKKGESASRSLNQAMKEMRETEEYKEPKYWAPFFLIGDDVTITV